MQPSYIEAIVMTDVGTVSNGRVVIRVDAVTTAVLLDLVDASPDGMLLAERDGRMLVVNRQMEALFGYDRSEMLGQPVEMLLPQGLRGAHAAHRARYAQGPYPRPMGTGLVLTGRRRDGSQFPTEISLSPLRSVGDLRTIATVRDVTDRVEVEERLRRAERDVAVGEERRRVVRELHDRTLQHLFATGLAAQSLRGRSTEPGQRRRLHQMVGDLDAAILDLRSSVFELAFPHPSRSLRAEVLDVCTHMRSVLGLAPDVRFDGPMEAVAPSTVDDLVAVLREALANVGRHARATEVSVVVSVDRELVLRVDDDGVGPPPGAAGRPAGGLRGMRDRAEHGGGTFGIATRDPRGTRLEWRVPLT